MNNNTMLFQTLVKYSCIFLRSFNKQDFRIFLESSPAYPNLLSVLQALHYAGLISYAGQCNWEYLCNLKYPFLLHLNIKSKESLAISRWNQTRNVLEILHPSKSNWETQNENDIVKVWTGVVIYTDATPIKSVLVDKNTIAISSLVLIVLVVFIFFEQCGIQGIFTLPILLGSAISLCMYWQTYISPIRIVDKICHSASTTDCNALAESRYSNFGMLSMNCMAVSYFLSQLSCLLMSCALSLPNYLYNMCLMAAIVVLPTTAYSVYSQYKVGKICPMCLLILACIILQSSMLGYLPYRNINLGLIAVWVVCMACYLCMVTLFSHNRLTHHEYLIKRIENLKIKRCEDVFLMKSTSVGQIKAPISLGTKTSNISVTTIISPSCKHCRRVVSIMLSLIERKLEFRWDIILGETAVNDSERIKTWIQSFVSDEHKFIKDLYLWSNGGLQNLSFEPSLASKDTEIKESYRINARHIKSLNISGFPRFILNGRLLSQIYSVEDIGLMIADQLIEITS